MSKESFEALFGPKQLPEMATSQQDRDSYNILLKICDYWNYSRLSLWSFASCLQ